MNFRTCTTMKGPRSASRGLYPTPGKVLYIFDSLCASAVWVRGLIQAVLDPGQSTGDFCLYGPIWISFSAPDGPFALLFGPPGTYYLCASWVVKISPSTNISAWLKSCRPSDRSKNDCLTPRAPLGSLFPHPLGLFIRHTGSAKWLRQVRRGSNSSRSATRRRGTRKQRLGSARRPASADSEPNRKLRKPKLKQQKQQRL